VATDEAITPFGSPRKSSGGIMAATDEQREQFTQSPLGRWPANIVLSYPQDEYELRRDVTPEQFAALRGWLDENAER
jgi:hypothetical protein